MEENQEELEQECNVFEFSLDEEDIDELIINLKELKQTKKSFGFDIDEENSMLVHHEESEEDTE